MPLEWYPVPESGMPQPLSNIFVLDFSTLLPGPMATLMLAEAGADVVKVESSSRPDGARWGPKAFFDLLNGGKRSATIDLRTSAGVDELRGLILGADVVLESSRPRALEHLGLVADHHPSLRAAESLGA